MRKQVKKKIGYYKQGNYQVDPTQEVQFTH
jgi:hypothetical protein